MDTKLVILAKLNKRINIILINLKLKQGVDYEIRILQPSFLAIKFIHNIMLDVINKIDTQVKNEFGEVIEIKKSIQYGFIFKLKELQEIRIDKLNTILNE